MPPVHMGLQMSSRPQPTMCLAPMRPHMTLGKCGYAHCPGCQNHGPNGSEEQPHGWRQCIRNSKERLLRQGQKPMSVPQDRAIVGPSKSARKAAKWPSRAQRRQGETVKRICTWSIIEGSRVNGPPSRTVIVYPQRQVGRGRCPRLRQFAREIKTASFSTASPGDTKMDPIQPSPAARSTFSIFIASRTSMGSPSLTS